MTCASAFGSPTGASSSGAPRISDGPSGQSVETAGQPQAKASTSTFAKPSRRDESAKSEARDMKAKGFSTQPGNDTWSERSSARALLSSALRILPSPKHPCFEASPDSVFFDGFWQSGARVFHRLSTSGRPSGHAEAGRPRCHDRPVDSFPAWRAAAGRGPSGRQVATAASVLSSHMRRSRSRAFAITTSFRMTAVTATLWTLPPFPEPSVEVGQLRIVHARRHRRHVEDVPRSPPSAG